MVESLQRVGKPDWYRVRNSMSTVTEEFVEVGVDRNLMVDHLVAKFGSSEAFVYDVIYWVKGSPVHLLNNMLWILGEPLILIKIEGLVELSDIGWDPGLIEIHRIRIGP